MASKKDNRERRQYQHLPMIERGKIEALRREGYGISAIVKRINRDKSPISRELKRGTVKQRARTKYLSDPSKNSIPASFRQIFRSATSTPPASHL